MKTFSLVILLFSSKTIFGQLTEKYYTYNWKECQPNEARFYTAILKTDSGFLRNDYYIHEKSIQMSGKYADVDLKIHDGYFHYFHSNGSLNAIGKYVNGKKEGLWIHYYPDGMMMDSGVYSNGNSIGITLSWHSNGFMKDSSVININGKGVKVSWFDNGNIESVGYITNFTKIDGTWKFYHKNGQMSSKETYSNDFLTDKLYFDEKGLSITDTTTKERDPIFPGGNKAWVKYLEKQVYFPSQFKIVNADKAVVVVSFTINENGKIEDVDVSTPFYPEFDKIAKNAILKSPDWEPAFNHNRKIKSRVRQPITFSQSDE